MAAGAIADFMAFASNPAYLAGLGHQMAALEDSRQLQIVESKINLTDCGTFP